MGTEDAHSVASHLHVDVEQYDREIRRFVPQYELGHDEVVAVLMESPPHRVLDVGSGTGALAQLVLEAVPAAHLTLLDADRAMLDQARVRFGGRGEFVALHGPFQSPLPQVDAVISSLALHHVPKPEDRVATYRHLLSALNPRGVLVNLDAMFDVKDQTTWERWADHLVESGDTREQAFARFASWQQEDTYYPLERELEFLREAGAREAFVQWRGDVLAAVVAFPR